MEFLTHFDQEALIFLNSFHSHFFDFFMYMVTQKFIWVPFYVFLAYLILIEQKWRKAIIWLLAIGIAIAIADQVTASLIRPFVARLRPSHEENPVSEVIHLVNDYRAGGFSFPSCHASNSAVLATMICLITKRTYVKILICFWAALHIYSRIYLGVHYPLDIITGVVIGVVCAFTMYFIITYSIRYFKFAGNSSLSSGLSQQRQTSYFHMIYGKLAGNYSLVLYMVFTFTLLVITVRYVDMFIFP